MVCLSDIVTLIMLRQPCYVGPMKYCVFTRNLSVLVNRIDLTFNIMWMMGLAYQYYAVIGENLNSLPLKLIGCGYDVNA